MAKASSAQVAGVDRWRGGWIAALAAGNDITLVHADDITALADRVAGCQTIAIDMPLALVETGRRSAEAEIRVVLKGAARSVFTSPCRAASLADSQAEATVINRANGGPGISAQAFGLFASIAELREFLIATPDPRYFETHPETSFTLMNRGEPLASKKSARGVAQRLQLLTAHFGPLDAVLAATPVRVPIDDALDALGAAWSAQRVLDGSATLFGPEGRDDQALPLGIRI